MSEPKAWIVTRHDEEASVVVMARNYGEALRLGVSEMDGDLDGAKARRAPKWDGGQPSRADLLADGWWFDCSGCSHRVYDHGCDRDECEQAPVFIGGDVYCAQACRDALMAECGRVKAEAAENERLGREALAARFPGATFVRSDSLGDGRVRVTFDAPGVRGASWEPGEPEVFVAAGDRAAWDAWEPSQAAAWEAAGKPRPWLAERDQ